MQTLLANFAGFDLIHSAETFQINMDTESNIPFDKLLGSDFLNLYNAQLDCKNNLMILVNKSKIIITIFNHEGKHFIVPARSEMVI